MNKNMTMNDIICGACPGVSIIKFGADSHCGMCKVMTGVIKQTLTDHPEFKDIKYIEVDTDDCEESMLEHFKIRSIPTTLILKDCIVKKTINGVQTETQISSILREILSEDE